MVGDDWWVALTPNEGPLFQLRIGSQNLPHFCGKAWLILLVLGEWEYEQVNFCRHSYGFQFDHHVLDSQYEMDDLIDSGSPTRCTDMQNAWSVVGRFEDVTLHPQTRYMIAGYRK